MTTLAERITWYESEANRYLALAQNPRYTQAMQDAYLRTSAKYTRLLNVARALQAGAEEGVKFKKGTE